MAETREEMERTPDDEIADQRIQAAYDAHPLPPHDPVDAALRAWRRTVRLGDQTMRQTFAAGFAAGLAHAQADQIARVRERLAQLRTPTLFDPDADVIP